MRRRCLAAGDIIASGHLRPRPRNQLWPRTLGLPNLTISLASLSLALALSAPVHRERRAARRRSQPSRAPAPPVHARRAPHLRPDCSTCVPWLFRSGLSLRPSANFTLTRSSLQPRPLHSPGVPLGCDSYPPPIGLPVKKLPRSPP